MSLEVHGEIQNVSGFSVRVLVERRSRTDRVRNQREMETETEMGGGEKELERRRYATG